MNLTDRVHLSGIPGSPYTRKMLAVLRYRHIPYSFLSVAEADRRGLPQARVPLFPTFYRAGEAGPEAYADSTPVIRELDAQVSARRVIPSNPALALLDRLIEDYGDEWLTKCMFHYRWINAADIKQSETIIPLWFDYARPDAEVQANGAAFAKRQIDRLHVVGSNQTTGPLIEASYRRFLAAADRHLTTHRFMLGARPGAGDFALFGQLTQLALFDPTPTALTMAEAPRIHAWTTWVEDLSGEEPEDDDWLDADALPQTLTDVLTEIGRTYVPVMMANARAVAAGAERVEAHVDGASWVQRPFPYQAKCIQTLRDAWDALPGAARQGLAPILDQTGCAEIFAAAR